MNSRIVVISDLHAPFEHRDSFQFLEAVKKKYKPTRVICIGDDIDHQAMNFWESDPDMPSIGDELEIAIKHLSTLYKLFPKADIIDSNHGSMALRKMKHHGISLKYLRTVKEVVEAPSGWNWFNDLKVKLPNGQYVYFHHGLKKQGIKVTQQMGMNVVQGHYHTEYKIEYTSSPTQLLWSMQIGCLIDSKSMAFAYDRTNLGRPILGTGVIINSQPKLVPMILNSRGRWIKELK